ncbi:Ubiquitin carboxyl-terminal hydrolase 16 [Mortierella sp. AD031]|nr:Ubiquitin carboxyl-terminal hydrolase 16 [Mortierella sp. AD031]
MAGKKKKSGKKSKGPNKGTGPGQNDADDVSAMDEAILAQVIAGSQEDANNAGIATLEESVLSEAIEASLQSFNLKNTNTTSQDTPAPPAVNPAPNQPAEGQGSDNDVLMDIDVDDYGDDAQFASGIEKCPHLKESVKISKIRKILTATTHPTATGAFDLDRCHGCKDQYARIAFIAQKVGMPLAALTANDPIDHLIEPLSKKTLWLCLSCSEVNCDLSARSNKSKGSSKVKVYAPGLQNLGNTCFFNSVMQVLVETKSLREILLPDNNNNNNHSSNKSLSATTRTGLGPLTTTFKDFLFTMWKQQGGTVKPRDLFRQITNKWETFRGRQEQDSQELMRHLFDGIRQEEADLIEKRVAAEEQQSGRLGGDQKSKTAETALTPPKYVPFIDTCFSGKFVSVIVCGACKKCSYKHEDYYDLSLDIRGAPVSVRSGSLMDQLKAKAHPTGYKLSRTFDSSDGLGILVSDQGSEERLRHLEELLKNVPSQTHSEALSIERSLIQFTNVELMDGENKYACGNCYKLIQSYKNREATTGGDGAAEKKERDEKDKVKVETEGKGASNGKGEPQPSDAIHRTAYKRLLLTRLPSTLVLHLKRFEHTSTSSGLMKKIDDHVDIPVELDMARFCVPKNGLCDETESSVKELAVAQSFEGGEKAGSTKYRLYGATVHHGSHATGHYNNFVLSSKVEVPPAPASADSSKSTTTTTVSNGVGVVLPDIPLSQMLAQQSQKKKKKKGSGGGGGGGGGAGKKGTPFAGANGVIAPAVEERPADKTKDTTNTNGGSNSLPTPLPEPVKDTREWIYCSDTLVRSATLEEVLASRAYLLYYERC